MRTVKPGRRDSSFRPGLPIARAVTLLFIILLSPCSAQALNRLDLNTASEKQLESLPFIGSSRAASIIEYRHHNGPFENVEELLQIQGIGRTSLEAITPYLVIGGEKTGTSSNLAGLSVQRRITLDPGSIMLLPDHKYYEVLVDFIREAERSIDMAMYLFKITDSPRNLPRLLMEAIVKARKRGVMVHIVLEQSDYNDRLNRENRRIAGQLQKKRIDVDFDGLETTSHTKLIVIDRRFTFLGSHNLTHSALAYNHEMSLVIDNQNLAEEMIDHIDTIASGR